MPELKEKPTMDKPKHKAPAILSPKQAARVVASKYQHQFEQRIPGEESETEYATGRTEGAASGTVAELTKHVHGLTTQNRANKIKERPHQPEAPPTGENTSTGTDAPPTAQSTSKEHAPPVGGESRTAASTAQEQPPGQRRAVVQRNRAGQTPGQTALNNRRRGGPAACPSSEVSTIPRAHGDCRAPAASRGAVRVKERPRMSAAAIKSRTNLPRAAQSPSKAPTPKVPPRLNQTAAKLTARRTRQHAQRQITQRMVTQAKNAARATATVLKRAAIAVVKAAAALIGSLVSIAGGGILLVALVIVVVIAAVANSPFGLFFAAEKNAPDTVSVAEAVARVNMDYNAKLEELQAGDYNSIEMHGQAPDWPDVLAVFAAKTAGADIEGIDVATLDAARVTKLKAVFEEMTAITSRVEEIDHPGDGEDDPGWTEYILHITITPKSADDMRTAYAFTAYQNSALDELLTDRAALSSLAGSLTITNADVSAILDALPDDLSPERREAVRTALQLVGKVSYFWGGKSYTIGWDSRWGTLQKVWAAGNSTSGTYRPFGLDCSGFVDWIFNNAMSYIPGHGGGASAQHTYSTDIPWADAQPGDLAFFPDDSHVGIVVGRSADGGILVCHCSYSQNNVVVTDCAATGFTAIGTPDIFS